MQERQKKHTPTVKLELVAVEVGRPLVKFEAPTDSWPFLSVLLYTHLLRLALGPQEQLR